MPIWSDDRRLEVFSSPQSWTMRSYDSTKNYGLSLRPKLLMERGRRMQLGMDGSFMDFEDLTRVAAH
jgi:hypothetical protein